MILLVLRFFVIKALKLCQIKVVLKFSIIVTLKMRRNGIKSVFDTLSFDLVIKVCFVCYVVYSPLRVLYSPLRVLY